MNGAGGADGAARRRAAVVAVLVAATVPNMVCATGRTPDLNRGLASWLIVGQSPIPERLLVQRYPMGGPPVDAGLDMDGAMAALGPAEGDVVATFSFDSQVSESFLVSLGRLARRDPKVVGVCLHPESVAAGPRPRGLIVATRGGDGWPTGALIRRSFEDYYGWDDAYEAVIARLDELRASATLVEQRDLAQGETLTVWRIAPGP